MLNCLSAANRQEVDALVKKATASGGRTYKDPIQYGDTMYGHGFQDPDGHMWEVMWMATPTPA